MKYANNIDGKIIVYSEIPKKWKGSVGFQYSDEKTLKAEGFYPFVTPIVKEDEKLSKIYFDEEKEIYTFNVINKNENELAAIKKQKRNELLKKGVVVNNIWFNEEKLTQFTVMAQMCTNSGVPEFEWGKEDGWGMVTIAEAFSTANKASALFSKIYKDNA